MARRGAKLGTSVLDLDIDDSKFHSKMSGAAIRAQKFTEQTGKNLTQAGKAISSVGSTMTRNVTLPILAAGGAVGKLGFDFDKTMREIVALTSVTGDQIGGIREELLKLGPEVGKSPQELAEAFYFVASAGFEGAEALEVVRITAKAAAAGLGDTSTVAQVVGSAINAYGRENITAAEATDTLVAAIGEGSAEAPEFAGALGNVIGSAAQIGASFPDVTAAIAAMTNVGIGAEEAVTSLNQIFVSLFKPTNQAADALEGMGLSAESLRTMIAEEGLLPTLQLLAERFAGNAEATATVFGNVRALRGVLALTGGDAEKTTGIFDRMQETVGATGEAFDSVARSDSFKLERAMAQLQATGIELGADVLPLVVEVLQEVADAARGLSEWWGTLDDETRELVIRSLAFLAVAGPVLIVVGKLTTAVGGLFKAAAFLSGAKGIPLLVTKLGALQVASHSVLGPIAAMWAAFEGGKQINRMLFPDNAFDTLARAQEVLHRTGMSAEEYGAALEASGKKSSEFNTELMALLDAGVPVEAAIRRMTSAAGEVSPALEQAGEDWQTYQEQISGAAETGARNAKASLASLPPEIQQILVDAGVVIDEGAGEAFDGISEEAQKAREAAIAHMKGMLTGLTSLFDSEEDMVTAWKGLIERMDDPYTEAERRADIFSKTTIANIQAAIRSGDPAVAADTTTLVNNMLAQVALMEPGALESGEAVPPALRAGMDSQMAALISWIETNVTGQSLSALTLDEATELGLDGIWRYKEGMRHNAAVAVAEARNIAARARQALGIDAYSGGVSLVSSWINGMTGAWGAQQWRVKGITGHAARIFGQSLPTEGPLKGGVAPGGFSVGESWIGGVVDALDRGLRAIESGVGTVAESMAIMPRIGTPSTPALASLAASGGAASTAGVTSIANQTVEYHLHYNGREPVFDRREDFLDELEDIARFKDGAVR